MTDAARSDASQADWSEIRRRTRRRMERLIEPPDAADLDDLVQEACVRLLRASRRELIEDWEAMIATVARRTFTDHIRRQQSARRKAAALALEAGTTPAEPMLHVSLGTLADRLPLIVQEVFLEQGATECLELLDTFCAGRPWSGDARAQELPPATLRKRWSRCLAIARSALRADPSLKDCLG
jgi:DNA-directed RNA polymerase specialized sigma24 family protein